MPILSAIAIYFLFWWMSLFVVLPIGIRTSEEAGQKTIAGHAESAPHHFSWTRIVLRTTLVSAVLFGLFLLNFVFGWITPDMLDWTRW